MKNWTIKKRIILCFAIIFALVAGLAVTSYTLLRKAKAEAKFMAMDAIPGMTALSDINDRINSIQINLLRALLARTPDDRKKFQEAIAQQRESTLKAMADYEKSISLPEDRQMFNEMVVARDHYVDTRKQMFLLCDAGKADDAYQYAVTQVRPAYDDYAAIIDKMMKWNIKNAVDSGTRSENAVTRANFLTGLFSVSVIVLGIIFAAFTVRSLNVVLRRVAEALDDGSSQVASAAGQVSSASQSLAEGASEQAASLEETSSSLEEMSSMTKRNAENSQKANDLARQTRDSAEKGAGDMKEMNSAMQAIKDSSDDIAKIIKTIDEIAFQTNILALNAAVEAARAGEAGMGFAVVADEVRNLAQRSAQAAKETSAKIEGAIAKSGQGVAISAKVAKALDDILSRARQVDELAAEVASASREQSQGINQVNLAVGQMDKVTQSNAANAEESAAAAEELNAQAESMKHSVKDLLNLVGNASKTETYHTPVATTTTHVQKVSPSKVPAAVTRIQGNGRTHTVKSAPAPQAPELAATNSRGGMDLPADDEFKDF